MNTAFFVNEERKFRVFLALCKALLACLDPILDPDRKWEAAERQVLVKILENMLCAVIK